MRGLAALLLAAIAAPAAIAQSLPAYLEPISGSHVGKPYRVVVNGEPSAFVNCAVDQPLEQVVAHYRAALAPHSSLADLPKEQQAERGLENGLTVQRAPGWTMLGFVDQEGRSAGVVAYADPDPRAKRTMYYLTAAESKAPLREVDPDADAPGRDPPDVPRADGLRRVFSIERYDPELSTTHVFEGKADPAKVAEHYRSVLPAHGWRPDPAVGEEFPAGNLQAFERADRTCQIMVAQDAPSGRIHVTVVVQARSQ